jgi:hypothetical protein
MPFRSGSVSYARFQVTGPAPTTVNGELLTQLNENTIRPTSVGDPPETEFGWVTGLHIYDTDFDPENVAFGGCLLAAMRVDTNKTPAEVKRAYRAMAEAALAADSETGFLSKRELREAKEDAEERCRRELAGGMHRRSRMLPIMWDLERKLLLAPAFGDAARTALLDLFHATFDLKLLPLSAGGLAREIASIAGKTRTYEDLKPSGFTSPPAEALADDDGASPVDPSRPQVPWSYSGPEPSDFVGNEFLIWLWHQCEQDEGLVQTPSGELAVVIDRVLDMDCAWEVTGKQTLRGNGPTRMPEAGDALREGKWPRKLGLLLAADGNEWELTLQGDRLHVSGAKIPKSEDPADTPRDLMEYRIQSIRDLDRALVALYRTFLDERLGSSWPTIRQRLGQWIQERRKPRVAVRARMPKTEEVAPI